MHYTCVLYSYNKYSTNLVTPSLLKIQKISWAQWRVPVIPATQEAEAGGAFEATPVLAT